MQPTALIARQDRIPPISPILAQKKQSKQEIAREDLLAANAINAANKARLDLIAQKAQAYHENLVERTLRERALEKEAIDQAEEQRQRDKANLREGRQTRKLASIQDVMDEQKCNGQVTHAEHDQMQQILQDLKRDSMDLAASASSARNDHEETLIDLTNDGFTRVTNKKKSPSKTQLKTVVDSPKRPAKL